MADPYALTPEELEDLSNPKQTALESVYGKEAVETIGKAKVFIVGAGGIGCELLKNLVKMGFRNMKVVDLDTIDVSNLNRQFLFRKRHVGHPKSKIASEAVLAMTPGLNIESFLGNVKTSDFGVDFLKQFDLVFNALDNLSARRHMNRLCLSTKMPLIESGTLGYNGQVIPILPDRGACFECSKKDTPKQYPVCTIRSTPDKPVHCIVWAKLLFAYCFGPEADREGSILSDLEITQEELEQQDRGTILKILNELFTEDIKKTASLEDKWKLRKPPTPIVVPDELKKPYAAPENSQAVQDTRQNLEQLLQSYDQLQTMKKEHGDLTFDKDVEATMAFVSSAANLRMQCYHIGTQSLFSNKGVAGNIVHAIATTNAVIAGMMVNEGIKVLLGRLDDVCGSWFGQSPRVLQNHAVEDKNPNCYVCSKARVTLKLDTAKMTLKEFRDNVLKTALGFTQPDINVLSPKPNFIEFGDQSEDYLKKTCKDVHIVDMSEISVEDFSTNLEGCTLVINHAELDEEEFPKGFDVQQGDAAPSKEAGDAAKMDEDDGPKKRGSVEAGLPNKPAEKKAKADT